MYVRRTVVVRTSPVILALVTVTILLGCGLFSDGQKSEIAPLPPVVSPPSETASSLPATSPLGYDGPSSLEKRILASPVIARVRLNSVSSTTESGLTVRGTKYILILEFRFSVLEYLKGSGASDIVAVWNSDQLFDTRQDAETALPSIVAARDTQWDDREAIIFLKHSLTYLPSTQQAGRYYLSGVSVGAFGIDDNYSIASRHNKLWLPTEAAAGAQSQPTGDQQSFLMDLPPTIGTAPTITLGEIKTRIATVTAKLNAGDGSEEYTECLQRTYQYEGTERYRKETEGRDSYISAPSDHSLDSGLASSTVVYEDIDYGGLPDLKDELWLDGGDSALFDIELGAGVPHDWSGDGVNDSIEYARRVVSARPIPEGVYRFHFNHRDGHFVRCQGFTVRYEWTVAVTDPEGTLHEFFFDPVTDGTAVAADSTNGVLKPASFTDSGGATTTISRLEWATSTVTLTASPTSALAGLALDFIELDGTVSLTLDYSDATVDTSSGTLAWNVDAQPWHAGDELMVRIRRQYAPAPSNVDTWTASLATVIDWDAVDGAAYYAVEWRAPGGLDEWENTSLRSWVVGDPPPATTTALQVWFSPIDENLRCSATREFRVRSFGDGARYAARWGSPSAVVVEPGTVCNAVPAFGASSYNFSVREDVPVGTVVGSATATDFDATDSPTHSITDGNDDGKFAIDAGTGSITVAAALDRNATSSYSLSVQASDGRTVKGVHGRATVTVNIAVTEPLASVGVPEPERRIARTSATLTWPAVEGADRYQVRHRVAGESWPTDPVEVSTTTHTIDLDRETTYEFQARAHGDGTSRQTGWGTWSEALTSTTNWPPLPTGFTLTAISSDSATLSWDAVHGAASYLVEYRWVNESVSTLTPETADTSLTVTGLDSGKRYLFKVRVKGDGIRYTDVSYRPGSRPLRGTTN